MYTKENLKRFNGAVCTLLRYDLQNNTPKYQTVVIGQSPQFFFSFNQIFVLKTSFELFFNHFVNTACVVNI